MTTLPWDRLIKSAEEAGVETSPLAPGEYDFRVESGKFDAKRGFSWRLKVVGGPNDGKGAWLNQRVPNGEEKNPAGAAAAFVRTLGDLGITPGTDAEAAAQIPVGKTIVGEVKHTPNPRGGVWVNVNVKKGSSAPAAPAAPSLPFASGIAPAADFSPVRPI